MPSSVWILGYSEETSRVQRMQSLGNLVDSIHFLCLLCRRGVTLPGAEASSLSKLRFFQLDVLQAIENWENNDPLCQLAQKAFRNSLHKSFQI